MGLSWADDGNWTSLAAWIDQQPPDDATQVCLHDASTWCPSCGWHGNTMAGA